jgi:hypothetical protein
MLICFGLGWPISIMKSLRTRVVIGKSPTFMIILCIGYVSGLIHKFLCSPDWIIALYALNLIMVLTDLALYYRYLPENKRQRSSPPESEVSRADRTENCGK